MSFMQFKKQSINLNNKKFAILTIYNRYTYINNYVQEPRATPSYSHLHFINVKITKLIVE